MHAGGELKGRKRKEKEEEEEWENGENRVLVSLSPHVFRGWGSSQSVHKTTHLQNKMQESSCGLLHASQIAGQNKTTFKKIGSK